METPKKKKNDTMPHIPFWRRHYPLVAVIATAITLIFYFIIQVKLFELELSTILYPLLGTGYVVKVFALILFFPIILLFILLRIFVRTMSSKRTVVTMVRDFIAFLLVGFTIYMILAFFFLTIADRYSQKDSLKVNEEGYALASRNTYDDFGYGNFILYKCDNQVLFCSNIYETNWGYDTSHPAELAFNEATQEITIIINSEVVHTHQLE